MVFGGPPAIGIKPGDVLQKWGGIKIQQFLAFLIIEVKRILRVVA